MPEYDELVKALRTGYCDHKLLNEAADAIEEMSIVLKSYRNRMKAGCDWIPVTKRLPEKFQPVWAACKMDGRDNWTFETLYDPYLKCPWGTYMYLENGKAVVYAWMDRSAPDPPREEE